MEGVTVGRCSQSNVTAQRGRRDGLRESCSLSPQPHGHRKQAHFWRSPSLTRMSTPSESSSGVGCLVMVRPITCGRGMMRVKMSKRRSRSFHMPTPLDQETARHRPGPNSRFPRKLGRTGPGLRPVGDPASDQIAASVARPSHWVPENL